MNALINNCLKPVASTLPLATDEIKKLHGFKYFLKLDAMHAFWAIPLDEESKKLMAFQTHEGVFAWNRLTMGCRATSQSSTANGISHGYGQPYAQDVPS